MDTHPNHHAHANQHAYSYRHTNASADADLYTGAADGNLHASAADSDLFTQALRWGKDLVVADARAPKLLPLMPEAFGHVDEINYPRPPMPLVTDPIELSSMNADGESFP